MSDMTIQSADRRPVPADTFQLRLVIARLHKGYKTADAAGQAIGRSGQTWRNWEAGIHIEAAQDPAQLHWIALKMNVDEDWLRDGGPLSEQSGPDGPGGVAATREQHECLIDHTDDALTRLIAAQWRDPEPARAA